MPCADSIQIAKLLLLGESMGGALALKVAADNPDIVDGVIASEPAYRVNVNFTYPEAILNLCFIPARQIASHLCCQTCDDYVAVPI